MYYNVVDGQNPCYLSKKLASFTALIPVKVPKLVQTFFFQQTNTVGIFHKQAVIILKKNYLLGITHKNRIKHILKLRWTIS